MRISRRRHRGKRQQQTVKPRYRTNRYIRVPEVRLIDEQGVNHGVVSTQDALAMAEERGLDLIEVSPLANPPVAKIEDFSKLKYEEEKERRKQQAKQKKVEIKGIRLSVRIGQHDADVRKKAALKFLGEGHKVKIEMILRGRERRHVDLAKDNIKKFIEEVNAVEPVKTEGPISMQGGKLSVLISK